MRAQKTISQGFVFAQKAQQQVLRLDIRRPELACLIAREKDDAPCFFGIAFKHKALPPWLSRGLSFSACGPTPGNHSAPPHYCNPPATQSMAHKRWSVTLIALPELIANTTWLHPSETLQQVTISPPMFRFGTSAGKLSIPGTT